MLVVGDASAALRNLVGTSGKDSVASLWRLSRRIECDGSADVLEPLSVQTLACLDAAERTKGEEERRSGGIVLTSGSQQGL